MKVPVPLDIQALEIEIEGGWMTIWFNQVEKRNALTDELRSDLHAAFDAVRADRGIRGITMRGRGGVFCAGGDLKHFRSDFQTRASLDEIKMMSRDAAAIFDEVNEAPQVVVALIEGAALAGGFGLACCADVVISAEDAKFAMTETSLGLSPAQIAPFVIQKMGYATGRRLMLTAARFDGREAFELGMADFIGRTMEDLEAIEAQIRRQVLKCAPEAVAETKKLLRDMQGQARTQVVDLAASNFAERMQSEEAKEGIAAFLGKRTANWAVDEGPHR